MICHSDPDKILPLLKQLIGIMSACGPDMYFDFYNKNYFLDEVQRWQKSENTFIIGLVSTVQDQIEILNN